MIALADPELAKILGEIAAVGFMCGALFVVVFVSMTWVFLSVAISISTTICGIEKRKFTQCLTISLLWVVISILSATVLTFTARAASVDSATTFAMSAFTIFMVLAMLLQSFFELTAVRSLLTALVANVLSFAAGGFLMLAAVASLGMWASAH